MKKRDTINQSNSEIIQKSSNSLIVSRPTPERMKLLKKAIYKNFKFPTFTRNILLEKLKYEGYSSISDLKWQLSQPEIAKIGKIRDDDPGIFQLNLTTFLIRSWIIPITIGTSSYIPLSKLFNIFCNKLF